MQVVTIVRVKGMITKQNKKCLDVETFSPKYYYKKYMDTSEENWHVDTGAQRVQLQTL